MVLCKGARYGALKTPEHLPLTVDVTLQNREPGGQGDLSNERLQSLTLALPCDRASSVVLPPLSGAVLYL